MTTAAGADRGSARARGPRAPSAADDPRRSIDWQAAWLAPLRELAPLVEPEAGDWRANLAAAAAARGIANARGLPIRFVDGADAGARAYEEHIAATGRVPSRCLMGGDQAGELHDLFNALVWLTFPRAKAALNRAQAAAIARDGIGRRRGPLRDAATLIDESGLLLADADGAVTAALAAHDWRRALVELRGHWGPRVRAYCFGHALMEKLAAPYKAITAVVVPLALPAAALDDRAALDAALARFVDDPGLAPGRLLRLPVLGVPGWWPANEQPSFYDDPAVFRPRRRVA